MDGGPQVTLDSGAVEGLSPTQYLLLSLAGCMGIDVKLILDKSRVPLETMVVKVMGERALTDPDAGRDDEVVVVGVRREQHIHLPRVVAAHLPDAG